nr:hypothetical protein [Deltaproteobacteria bacterium]
MELARLAEEERRKRERYHRGRRDEDLDAVIDDLPAVKTLRLAVEAVQTLVRNARTPEEIEAKIDRVSYGGGRDADVPASVLAGKLVFTTVHKIKGAESPRTWVLDETFGFRGEVDGSGRPVVKNGDTMSSNARQEEVNLWYVAVTRVKNQRGGAAGELYFVRNLEQLLGGGYVEEEDEEPRANPARRPIAHRVPARRVPSRPLRRVFGRFHRLVAPRRTGAHLPPMESTAQSSVRRAVPATPEAYLREFAELADEFAEAARPLVVPSGRRALALLHEDLREAVDRARDLLRRLTLDVVP